ncbi:hypothetical protein [Corynebacterium anserum]|uniref:Uncharacterized protein n=1 Tax=Corynebacterium anserum TaxID=2684406 RepID=A0A7G7YQG5_9CORY|nr:hypothetical protein [Corynebacterium anserum]MBC2682421.1 hypothetical protein [Corynebacterium anserum]QNH96735.1 hypothetical protein GP473_08805 [Corynebacterium anserum]
MQLFAQTLPDELVNYGSGVVNGVVILGKDLRTAGVLGMSDKGVIFVDCWVKGLDLSNSVLTNTNFFGFKVPANSVQD